MDVLNPLGWIIVRVVNFKVLRSTLLAAVFLINIYTHLGRDFNEHA